jgi:hypothetical protein
MVPSARRQRRYRARFTMKLKAENAAAISAIAKTGVPMVTRKVFIKPRLPHRLELIQPFQG